MAFKLDSIFNSKTLSQANDSYKVQYIERSKIIPNEHNKEIYSTDKTLLLSYGIEDKGLLEPLIVKKDDEGTYTLLSGHRRLAAIEIICKRNPDKASDFEVLPCILRNDDDDEEILIDANFYNREKTDAEKAKELAKKKEKLEQRKANGEKINGQLIKLIAEDMNISVHQAKKLNSINLNATDSVKDAFDAGEITVETAYHLSKADEKTQDDFIQNARDNDKPIATHEVKEAVAAAKPKMSVMPKTPISDNENASKPTVGTMSDNDEYLSFRTHGSAQNALTFHLTHIHSPHVHFYVLQPTGHLKQIGILPHLSHSKNAGIHYKKPFSSGVPGLFSLFPISQSDTCH